MEVTRQILIEYKEKIDHYQNHIKVERLLVSFQCLMAYFQVPFLAQRFPKIRQVDLKTSKKHLKVLFLPTQRPMKSDLQREPGFIAKYWRIVSKPLGYLDFGKIPPTIASIYIFKEDNETFFSTCGNTIRLTWLL